MVVEKNDFTFLMSRENNVMINVSHSLTSSVPGNFDSEIFRLFANSILILTPYYVEHF
jgi:hypothetical protein